MLLQVKHYCQDILENSKCNDLPFHNIAHTMEVVANTKKILSEMTVSTEESEALVIAAWFHDTGFSQVYEGHEGVSIKLATEFLKNAGSKTDTINLVNQFIESTRMPQNPKIELAKVLCDADLFHLCSHNFFYREQLLRKEWGAQFNKYYTDREWHQLNLEFLLNHQFLTEYGQNNLEKGLEANILRLKNLIRLDG